MTKPNRPRPASIGCWPRPVFRVDASHGRIHSQIVNLFDFGVIAEALHIAVSPEVLEVQHQLAVQAIVLVEHPVFLHELADFFQHVLCFRVVFRYLNGNLFDALVGEADHVVPEFLQKCYPLLHSFSFCVSRLILQDGVNRLIVLGYGVDVIPRLPIGRNVAVVQHPLWACVVGCNGIRRLEVAGI